MTMNQFISIKVRLMTVLPLAGLLALSSCHSEYDTQADTTQPARIRLSATIDDYNGGVTAETRTATTADGPLQLTQLASGQKVELRFLGGTVTDADGVAAASTVGTADGSGGLTIAPDRYLAMGEQEAWIDAYHPSAGTGDEYPGTAFTVRADQSGDAGYQASDLMYGSGVVKRQLDSYTVATGVLRMRHLMARIIVSVAKGDGVSSIQGVRIVSGWRTVSLVDNGTLGIHLSENVTLENHTGLSDQITPTEPVTMYSGESAAAITCTALVPPQQMAVSLAWLEVETDCGIIRYRFTADQTLQSGYSYQLNVAPSAPQAGTTVAMTGWSQNTGSTTAPTTAQSAPNTYYVGTQAFKMVPVKGGSFGPYTWPSSTSYTISGTLTDYYIGETEVTNALWKAVMGDLSVPQAHSDAKATKDSERLVTGDTYPVTWVTRDDIIKTTASYTSFIDRLNQLTEGQRPAGYRFCLPSYAQWGYAARGGIHSRGYTYAGGNTASEVMWVNGSSGVLHPVAQLRPNELGLYDMQGNNWEYLQDWHTALTASVSGVTDYSGPATGTKFVVVGYSYSDDVHTLAESYYPNGWLPAEGMNHHCGFRLCLRKVRVGDLYFSDGSWGTASENPGKTPVGIVFSTTTSTADQQRGYRSGYVMALEIEKRVMKNDNTTTMHWCVEQYWNKQVTDMLTHWLPMSSLNIPGAIKNDLDGLTHCLTACQRMATDGQPQSSLTFIDAAMTFRPSVLAAAEPNAPASSSGWYLPSMGQVYAILRAVRPDKYTGSETWVTVNTFYKSADITCSELDTNVQSWLSGAGLSSSQYDRFNLSNKGNYSYHIATCTETTSGSEANLENGTAGDSYLYLRNDGANVYMHFMKKDLVDTSNSTFLRVRPVLAF